MALSEKLYTLRKKSGLSQEQLAERLNVSRQAISKWESGASTPESDKLIAISRYFNVSLDSLMREDDGPIEDAPPGEQNTPAPAAERTRRLVGLTVCVGGVVCLVIWGLLSLLSPAASAEIGESSRIALDGNGIYLLLCAAAVAAGAVLLLKGSGKR